MFLPDVQGVSDEDYRFQDTLNCLFRDEGQPDFNQLPENVQDAICMRCHSEKMMQDFNQNRRGRNLRKYCSDEGIDYKWLSEYKKQYSSTKGKVEKEEEPSLIPLQVIDERFSEQPVVQPEAKWCVKQLVIASPTGDELEIKCSNLAVVVELLRKMSM